MDMTDAQSLNHMTADGLWKVEQSKVYSLLEVRSEKQGSFAVMNSDMFLLHGIEYIGDSFPQKYMHFCVKCFIF